MSWFEISVTDHYVKNEPYPSSPLPANFGAFVQDNSSEPSHIRHRNTGSRGING
jgi:hypothetical protein